MRNIVSEVISADVNTVNLMWQKLKQILEFSSPNILQAVSYQTHQKARLLEIQFTSCMLLQE